MTRATAEAVRPRLRRSVDARITDDGTVYFLRGPDQDDLVVEADADFLRGLLGAMDGRRTPAELSGQLRAGGIAMDAADVERAVSELMEADVVDDAGGDLDHLAPHDAERYQRQLDYFADLLGGREAAAAQRRLLDAEVCVLGLGGLGTWTALALASAGVGGIAGVDRDRLELSNLNRQILYGEADVGALKAELAGEALRRFRADLRYRPVCAELDGPEAVEAVVRGADLVISTLDWPPHLIGRWVDQACFAAGVPYLSMTQHPPKIRVGPLYVPGQTGCFGCQEAAYRERYPLYETLEAAAQPVPPSATFGPACGAVGTIAANDAVAFLAGLHPPATLGAALVLDLRTYAVEREPVRGRPGCAACAQPAR